jgi:hypothetical protein
VEGRELLFPGRRIGFHPVAPKNSATFGKSSASFQTKFPPHFCTIFTYLILLVDGKRIVDDTLIQLFLVTDSPDL